MSDQYVGRDSQANDGRSLIYVGAALIVVGLGVQMAVGLASGNSADSPKPIIPAATAEADSSDSQAAIDVFDAGPSRSTSVPVGEENAPSDALPESESDGGSSLAASDSEVGPAPPADAAPGTPSTFLHCVVKVLSTQSSKKGYTQCSVTANSGHASEVVDLCKASRPKCAPATCDRLVEACGSLSDTPEWLKTYSTTKSVEPKHQ